MHLQIYSPQYSHTTVSLLSSDIASFLEQVNRLFHQSATMWSFFNILFLMFICFFSLTQYITETTCCLNYKNCSFGISAYLIQNSLSQPLSLPWQPMCGLLTHLLNQGRYMCIRDISYETRSIATYFIFNHFFRRGCHILHDN